MATFLTGCIVRGLVRECALEGHTVDELERAIEGQMADVVTECTLKGFLANETERNSVRKKNSEAMKLTVDAAE